MEGRNQNNSKLEPITLGSLASLVDAQKTSEQKQGPEIKDAGHLLEENCPSEPALSLSIPKIEYRPQTSRPAVLDDFKKEIGGKPKKISKLAVVMIIIGVLVGVFVLYEYLLYRSIYH